MTEKAGGSSGERIGNATMIVSLALSACVAATLLSVNISSARTLHMNQEYVTRANLDGALLGINSLDGSEWTPSGDAADKGSKRPLVLFGVAPDQQTGDLDFWQDVAAQVSAEIPEIQFVGLCQPGSRCSLPPGSGGVMTLLSAMDPVLVRVLTMASSQHGAFFSRGAGFKANLTVPEDRKALAAQIVGISRAAAEAAARLGSSKEGA